MKRLLLLAGTVVLASCANIGTEYAPPIKRQALEPTDNGKIGEFVQFADKDAINYVLNDVIMLNDSTPWRWSIKRPALRFLLKSTKGRKLVYDLTVPEVEFQATGPVHIQIFVNNHKVDEEAMDHPERKVVEKDIPADWLSTNRETVVIAEIDKLFYTPDYPQGRGFIINNVGFR